MSRRERLEARAERRRQWAESRRRKSEAGFAMAESIASAIPLGQPILVGHHSERRHRRDLERIDSGMRQGCESADMAKRHDSAAAGIEDQLDRSIFSDDTDAAESCDSKAAGIESGCERMKQVNAAFRKAPGADQAAKLAACVAAGTMTEGEAIKAAKLFAICPYERQPFPAYALTNARANARRYRERAKQIRATNAKLAEAEAAPGGVLVKQLPADHASGKPWVSVTFPEYPGREAVAELKAAGFYWARPSWHGFAENLPDRYRDGGQS